MRVSLRDSIGKSTILKSLTKNIKPDTKSLDKRENVVERREEMPNFHLKSQMVRPSQSASNIFKSGSVHKSNSNPKPANPLLKRDKKFNYNRVANATSGTNPDVPSKTKTKLERFPVKSKPEAKPKVSKEFQVQNGITVSNLASRLQITVFTLQKKIMKEFGMNLSGTDYINQELLVMLLLEFGKNPIVAQDFDLQKRPEPIDWSTFPKRDPIVTIMGHVDHGKTTLLDSLRGTSVVSGEHGGITQHIGAFSVLLPSGKRITFLDTPGHAAFSAMRKRGAQVTDICVLVVAADDGLMPQTIEAINHCLEASVPIIVALNKCDKPNIDKKRVLEQLAQHNVLCEEMGGEVPCVAISGKTKMGLDELEDTIIATAEINDYRGDYDGAAEGTIIESKMTQKLGVVATVLISRGTLRLGSYILAGNSWCKVKRIVDDTGKSRSTAGPSIPVEVQGWKGLPEAGDQVLETQDEVIIFYQATTKKVIKDRERRAELAQSFKEIELLNEKASVRREEEENTSMNGGKKISSTESGPKKFNIIIKGAIF